MKKRLLAVTGVVVTLAWCLALNTKFGSIPPLGKFLNPFRGFWQNAESAVSGEETLALQDLKAPVTVLYDSLMVPHIFAEHEEDLFRAQGYVTARHRLWQMEFQTHAAAGRVSEIVGQAALDFDREKRRKGMPLAAQNAYDAMINNPIGKMVVEQYTAGVNDYIQSLSPADYPIEYKLLDYSPEPWTPIKCAYLLKTMAETLNLGEKDIEMTNALNVFGRDLLDVLYPDREPVSDPIVDKAGRWNFKPITLDSVPLAVPKDLISIRQTEKPSKDVGSNNWAVAGSKTKSGAPLLANDPHLSLKLPSIWYIVHLSAPGINVMGASLPAAPNVISGYNDSIAWGVTNAQRDLVDWYKIEFKDASKNEYQHDGQWKPVRKVIEKIAIRGAEPFYDTVIYTHHGPVKYEGTFRPDNELKHYAFRWISHDPSEELMTFYKLNRARNHHEYMEALDHFSSPAQNFVFASSGGDIAMRIQGKYPVRRPNEGKFVLDGTRSHSEWQAFIPNEHNVMDLNPSRGFVSSANQYPADSTYPYYITARSYEAYRNRRINQVLSGLQQATEVDMMILHNDNYNLKAAESLPYFLTALDENVLSADEKAAFDILKNWDLYNSIDSKGAAYYEAWWDALYPMLWDEIKDAKVDLAWPTTFNTIRLLKTQHSFVLFDIQSTPEKENAAAVLRKSFSEAVANIKKWEADKKQDVNWADYKDTFIGHLLQGLPAFSYHVKHGGNHDIVNATSSTHGPSWRMVVSLEKSGTRAWATYPGGQSGNPGSPYYHNLLGHWTTGQYFPMTFGPSAESLKPAARFQLTLTPAEK